MAGETIQDPLAGLPRPTGNPAAVRQAGHGFQGGAHEVLTQSNQLKDLVNGVVGAAWVGMAGASCEQTGFELAALQARSSEDADEAATALLPCADRWEQALDQYDRARRMADEAMAEEAERLRRAERQAGQHEAGGDVAAAATVRAEAAAYVSPMRSRAGMLAQEAIALYKQATQQAVGHLRATRPQRGQHELRHVPSEPTDGALANFCYQHPGYCKTRLPALRYLRRYEDVIERAAQRFNIDETVLTALLLRETWGRLLQMRVAPGDTWKALESSFGFFGYNETVGLAQMRPELAADLAKKHFGLELSASEARDILPYHGGFAISLAAAYMHDLKKKYKLSDRQAYTAYAGSDEAIREWLSGERKEQPGMFEREEGLSKDLFLAKRLDDVQPRSESGPSPQPNPSPLPPPTPPR